MAGLFGLSVNSCSVNGFFLRTFYRGTAYGIHLGEDYSGLAVSKYKQGIKSESRSGLFQANFKDKIRNFDGTDGVGYCGSAPEPFFVKESRFGPLAFCFSGNITNTEELIGELDKDGHFFQSIGDIEIIVHLVFRGSDILDGIKIMNERVKGSWALLVLTSHGIYAARSPCGHWPLVLGKHKIEIATCVSSESAGFSNLGFNLSGTIEPGEAIFISGGSISLKRRFSPPKEKFCSFYGVYTSSPADMVCGIPATLIREKLGACLARKDIEVGFCPHIVIPVPDSGVCHAIGYKKEFDDEANRQIASGKVTLRWIPYYRRDLIKYGFSRSYLRPDDKTRKETAYWKILKTAETITHILAGLREASLSHILEDIESQKRIIVVICDDSVVRGTQIVSNLAPKAREIYEEGGIRAEIHIRASYPPLLSHCRWGKTTKKGETLAERIPSMKDRARELGVQSITHNTIGDLIAILGLGEENLCFDCALLSQK